MSLPLISVIVPVYNVELYLKRCLDSIINQTYTNLEIILINDGSPDNCGTICDEYKQKDDRIIVIHQENQGPGIARNSGINLATGEYISFVDSDDYLDIKAYEQLISFSLENNLDIVYFDYHEVYKDKIKYALPQKQIFLNEQEPLKTILKYQISDMFWDKFYKTNIVKSFPFPTDKIHEDTAITYKYFSLAQKAGYIGLPLYYYSFENENSIMTKAYRGEKPDFHSRYYSYLTTKNRLIFAEEKNFVDILYECYFRTITKAIYATNALYNIDDPESLVVKKAINDLEDFLNKTTNSIVYKKLSFRKKFLITTFLKYKSLHKLYIQKIMTKKEKNKFYY